MDRSIVWTASLAGTAFVVLALTGYRAHAADRTTLEGLRAQLEAQRVEPSVEHECSRPLALLEDAVRELGSRLTSLEHASRRVSILARPEVDGSDPEPATAPAESGDPDDAARQEFEGLLAQMIESGWDFSGSREGYQRFLELARGTGLLDEMIADLEARVAAAPEDIDGRMELADTYVGKLMTISGPEQGLWGGRAEDQWRVVADLDDGHWGAHYSLGTTYSYYPDVMGKTGDAILHLERARDIQRHMDPAPEQVQTYLFLARMYEREGKQEAARDVLMEGLQYHAGNSELGAALSRLD